jgi:hypothetical protein
MPLALLLPEQPHRSSGPREGADVKHKVFWVTGCAPAPTTTTTAPTTTTTTEPYPSTTHS